MLWQLALVFCLLFHLFPLLQIQRRDLSMSADQLGRQQLRPAHSMLAVALPAHKDWPFQLQRHDSRCTACNEPFR